MYLFIPTSERCPPRYTLHDFHCTHNWRSPRMGLHPYSPASVVPPPTQALSEDGPFRAWGVAQPSVPTPSVSQQFVWPHRASYRRRRESARQRRRKAPCKDLRPRARHPGRLQLYVSAALASENQERNAGSVLHLDHTPEDGHSIFGTLFSRSRPFRTKGISSGRPLGDIP